MSMTFKRWSEVRIAVWPVLLIGSCVASQPASAEECEVKIGAAGPMTGAGSSWGMALKSGTEFEAAWTNAHGGLPVGGHRCKVSVVSVDAQSTAAGGAAAANMLVSQNIHAVIGPPLSVENTGFKPVGRRAGIVNLTTAFANDALGPAFPLTFHQVQTPIVWGPIVVKAAKAHYSFKTAVVIGPNDQSGTDPGNALAKIYNENGVKTTTEWYQRGTTNFAAIATRVLAMKPDTVELGPMPPGEAGNLVKQMRDAGYTGAFGRLGAGGDVIINISGGVAAQNAFYWFDHVPTEDPAIKKLSADFENLMRAPIPSNALVFNAQISAEVLLRAISRAGTDQNGAKIAAELSKMTPESRYLGKAGWRGKAQYGINQEFSFPVGVNFISNGKIAPQLRLEIPSE